MADYIKFLMHIPDIANSPIQFSQHGRLRAEAGHHGGFQQRQLLYSRQLPRGLQRSGRAKCLGVAIAEGRCFRVDNGRNGGLMVV